MAETYQKPQQVLGLTPKHVQHVPVCAKGNEETLWEGHLHSHVSLAANGYCIELDVLAAIANFVFPPMWGQKSADIIRR